MQGKPVDAIETMQWAYRDIWIDQDIAEVELTLLRQE
jgi:hypothetical protein